MTSTTPKRTRLEDFSHSSPDTYHLENEASSHSVEEETLVDSPESTSSPRRGGLRRLPIALVMVPILAIAAYAGFPQLTSMMDGGVKEYPQFITEPVKSGPFRIAVTERGQIDSMKNATVTNSVEGSTTIIW